MTTRVLDGRIQEEDQVGLVESSVVNSYNEWDPLEEVIVGVIEGATVPEWDDALRASMPKKQEAFFKRHCGKHFPVEEMMAAAQDLEIFVHILEQEGVKVVRPERIDHAKPFETPEWRSASGLYQAMPRDILLVVGNEIIESPMAWRARYFEINAYRSLIKKYFLKGAKWTAAPKPQLSDELYNPHYTETPLEGRKSYGITEFEPTFDAADFSRCGRDIFVQQSNVTNRFGIKWLQNHLGEAYRIHILDMTDSHPMHIDATFIPLRPGCVLVNKNRLPKLPKMFKGWDVIEAPKPNLSPNHKLYMTSHWLSVNIISLDDERVIVEQHEDNLAEVLTDHGFKVIRCPFRNFNSFGGSFHCATCDIRRRGTLESYF